MATNDLNKMIKKAETQRKKEADKQLREQKKRNKEEARMERERILHMKASTIVSNQPCIGSFRVMDSTSEVVLKCIIEYINSNNINHNDRFYIIDDIFPPNLQGNLSLEYEKLQLYGMLLSKNTYDNGCFMTMSQSAFDYCENKEKAIAEQANTTVASVSNNTYNNYNGIMCMGDVYNSTFNIDNSFKMSYGGVGGVKEFQEGGDMCIPMVN